MSAEQDNLQALIRDAVGGIRAEIQAEATKFATDLEKRYGNVDNARIQGVETDFLVKTGAAPAAAPKVKGEKSPHLIGRFVRTLAATKSFAGAERLAASRGDGELVELFRKSAGPGSEKALAVSDFSAGGALVPEEFASEVIDALYPALTVSSLGAKVIPMPNGNLTLPFIDSGATGYYVGEVQNITPSQQSTGNMSLTAKKLAAVVPVSNDLLRTRSVRADAMVQADLMRMLTQRADQAFLRGTGASGEPRGVRSWAVSGNVFATAGATLAQKVSDLGKMQRLIADNNVPVINGGYVFNPNIGWALRGTLDSLGNFVFGQTMAVGVLMGQAFRESTACTSGEVIFGAFGHVIIGDTEQLEIQAYPGGSYYDGSAVQSGISQDVTPIAALLRHDLGCRYQGKEIAVMTGVSY